MKQASLFDIEPEVVVPPNQDGQLRDYQVDVLGKGRVHIGKGLKRGVIQTPTGGGKTFIAAEIARCALLKGNRTLILAHRRKLVKQLGNALELFKVPYGIIMSEDTRMVALSTIVASRDTLHAWKKREMVMPDPFQIIIVDEAHTVPGETYQQLLGLWPNAIIIGLTATPARGDGKRLNETFQWLECSVSISELVKRGWLVPTELYWPIELAKKRLKGKGKRELVGNPIGHWREHAEGLPTIAFCGSIKQSEKLMESFNKDSIAAEHIDASTPDAERERMYDRLKNRDTQVLCSVGLLIEGIDIAEVSCAILLKKFGSIVEYLQAIGRTKRPAPWINKTTSIVLDHSGASGVHGSPDDDIEWSLDPSTTVDQRRQAKLKDAKVINIVCRECGLLYTSKPKCPKCGTPAPKVIKKKTMAEETIIRNEVLAKYESVQDETAEWLVKESYEKLFRTCIFTALKRNSTFKMVAGMFRKETGCWPNQVGIECPDDWNKKASELYPNFVRRKAAT